MAGSSGVTRFLTSLTGMMALAVAGGVGLGRFATGGDTAEMVLRAGSEMPLGNPQALVPDRFDANAEYAAAVPILCEGCGPGLAERRALERGDNYALQMAEYEAQFEQPAFVSEPNPEPVVRTASVDYDAAVTATAQRIEGLATLDTEPLPAAADE